MSKEISEQKSTNTPADDDKELSELLDSALEDFSNEPSSANKIEPEKEDAEWTEEFIKQATSQFESNIAKFLDESQITSEHLEESFKKMSEAAAQVVSNPNQAMNVDSNFANTITQALQDLSQGAENVRNPFSEQDLFNMFGGQNGEENVFLPFMQGMMQSLLSKEILYPSLKDLLDKYPEWLEANGGSIVKTELDNYRKQEELMREVCLELEKEKETDTDEEKKKRFEKVLSLMQKLQDYGQPPKELIGDVDLGFPPLNQASTEQCNLM